ncbi:MAG: CapA family protein [Dehalococcoidia bacterium]|nr:CapA family protein [Dehalococcoidia bacterium]
MAFLPALLAACGDGSGLPEGIAVASGTATATNSTTATTPTTVPVATPTATPTAPPSTVTIAFVGDVMLDRDVEAAMHSEGAGYPFGAVGSLFDGADLVVANLEGTFTDIGIPLAKQYVFATDPTLAPGLLDVPVWGVSLSNNHATDYGVGGLERTIETLDRNGIAHFGAGRTEAEARGGVIAARDGAPTIAFLGYSDIGETVFASGEEGGVSRANVDAITSDVRAMRARPDVDRVVVTLHMGTEYTHVVTPRQQELARAAIEAGADLVVAHHPHVLQPVEEYRASDGRRGLILYSLGNFVFDLDADDLATLGEGPFQSVVAVVTFEPGQYPILELRPARIDVVENRPRPATPEEADAILELLQPNGR